MGCEMLTCHCSEKKERLPGVWEWGNARFSTGWHRSMVPMRGHANRAAARSIGRRASLSQRWDAGERNGTVLWSEPLFDKQH
jgi:hypothetical protein